MLRSLRLRCDRWNLRCKVISENDSQGSFFLDRKSFLFLNLISDGSHWQVFNQGICFLRNCKTLLERGTQEVYKDLTTSRLGAKFTIRTTLIIYSVAQRILLLSDMTALLPDCLLHVFNKELEVITRQHQQFDWTHDTGTGVYLIFRLLTRAHPGCM